MTTRQAANLFPLEFHAAQMGATVVVGTPAIGVRFSYDPKAIEGPKFFRKVKVEVLNHH